MEEHLTWLHDRLLLPIEEFTAGAKELVFVPDRSLHRVPFSALRSRRSGRFLVEAFDLAVAPSASLLSHQGTDHGTSAGLLLRPPSWSATPLSAEVPFPTCRPS